MTPPILFFLKATIKTQIKVPGFYKKDGTYVKPHIRTVLIDPEKDRVAVLAGAGSHYQKLAHKLVRQHVQGWDDLSDSDKHSILLAHATDLQQAASASAAISMWKKAALAGQTPKKAQWAAFQKLSPEKQAQLMAQVKDKVGSVAHLTGAWRAAPAQDKPAAPAPAPATGSDDPFAGMKLPGDLKEYLLKPSVTLKNGSTVSPKDYIDGLLADGYGNPEYFAAPKGSQAGFLTKPGSPKVTLNDKQMFYADAAFMARKRHGDLQTLPQAQARLEAMADAVERSAARPAGLAPSVAQGGPALSVRELPSEQRQAFFELRNQRNAAQFYQLPKEEKAQARQQAKLDGIRAQIRELESSIAFNRMNGMQDEVARLTAMHGTLSSSAAREHRVLLKKQDAVEQRRRLIQHLNGKLAQLVAGTDDPYFDPASGRSITDAAARAEYARAQAQAGRAYMAAASASARRAGGSRGGVRDAALP